MKKNRYTLLLGLLFFSIFSLTLLFQPQDTPLETGSTEFVTLQKPDQNSPDENIAQSPQAMSGSSIRQISSENEASLPSTSSHDDRHPQSIPDSHIREIPEKFQGMNVNVDPSANDLSDQSDPQNQESGNSILKANETSFTTMPMRAFLDEENILFQTSQVIDRLMGFVIVRDDSKDLALQKDSKPVVKNNRNGRLGIITGTLIVQFRSASENVVQFARDIGLLPLTSDPQIQTTYFQVQDDQNLILLISKAEQDPRVAKVTLEIVDTEKRISP